ncbi:FUSC family protein [Pseudofrankia sp. BMG5.37]|uniref:FUSC family protein n=1 Tax=Pseudofrankia sp. BMG5.37 TaxID=3050035 RepID=UPI002894A106|nr:FUSC family protein [Pseudofrankia sp. BMG5.37]MDT3439509.1 FUSC family protein [Pseudofrankia sp. BMG5.37]
MVCAIAFAVPLTVGELAGKPQDGLLATFGAFIAAYFPDAALAFRARALPVIGVGLALSAAIGVTAAGASWTIAVGISGLAALATLLVRAFDVPAPGAYPFIISCAVATQLPQDVERIGERVALTLAGAGFAWLLTISASLPDRHGPARRAAATALTSLADMLEAIGTPDYDSARHNAAQAVRHLRTVLREGSGQDRSRRALSAVAYGAQHVFDASVSYATVTREPVPPALPATLRELAAGIQVDAGGTGADLVDQDQDRAGLPGVGAAASRARAGLCAAVAGLAHPAPDRPAAPLLPAARAERRRRLDRDALAWPLAARAGLAGLVAAALAIAAGVDHPYWAPAAAATVVQGTTVRAAGRRSLQRAAGTAIGAVVALGILSVQLPAWWLIAMIAVLEGAAQVLMAANYALATVLITPLALILVEFARPGTPPAELVAPRLLDTLLGCAVGLVVVLLLWPHAAERRLPRAMADSLDATGDLLILRLTAGGEGPGDASRAAGVTDARERLETALARMTALHVDAEDEWIRGPRTADLLWPAVVAARRLGYLVLADPAGLHGSLPAGPTAVRAAFQACADAMTGLPVSGGDPMSALPAFTPCGPSSPPWPRL